MIKGQSINLPELSMEILKKMNTLRHNKMFYDVTLEIDKQVIYAHKSVLAACSQYFFTLFQKEDSHKNDTQISNYPIDFVAKNDFYILENLINFIYTQSMQISPSEIAATYALASKLKISEVSARLALNFLENLSVQTCIGTRKLAGLGNDPHLAQGLDKFIQENCGEIVNQPEYLTLPRINVYVMVRDARDSNRSTELSGEERSRHQMKIIDYVLKNGPDFFEGPDSGSGSNPNQGRADNRSLSPKSDGTLGKKGGLYLNLDRGTGNVTQCNQKTTPEPDKKTNGTLGEKRNCQDSNHSTKNEHNNIYDGLNPLAELMVDVFEAPEQENSQDSAAPAWNLIAFDESKRKCGDILITALVVINAGQLLNFRIKLYPGSGLGLENGTENGFINAGSSSSRNNRDSSSKPPHRELNGYPSVVENGGPAVKALTNGYHSPDSPAAETGPVGQINSSGTKPAVSVIGPAAGSLVAPMRSPRCGMGAVELAGKMLVCGGYDRGECLNSSEIYDPYTNTWSPFANMLGPRGRMDMAVLDGKVYVMGGSNGVTELNSAECFDLGTQCWNTLSAPMPQHCSNAGLAVLNKRIYCVGGQCGRTILKDVFVFDIQSKAWSPVRPLNTARYQACVASLNDKLYVVGGSNNWNCLNSVEIYDANADVWTQGPPIQVPRRGAGIATYRDKLYVIGGTDGTKVLPCVEIYDQGKNEWTFGPKLNVPRVNVKLVVVGDVLYAVGGFSGKSFLNSIEYLNPDLNEWTMVAPPSSSSTTPTLPGPALENLKITSTLPLETNSPMLEGEKLKFPCSSSFNQIPSGESLFLMHASPSSLSNSIPSTPIK